MRVRREDRPGQLIAHLWARAGVVVIVLLYMLILHTLNYSLFTAAVITLGGVVIGVEAAGRLFHPRLRPIRLWG